MSETFETVCVIGLGYVGLPTAAILASRGAQVLGVDVNETAVTFINQGKVHIVEPDLDIMVNGAVATSKLRAAKSPEPSDAFIIAVPTPFTDGHKPDLTYVEAAAKSLAPVIKKGDLIVIESTSPVGTTERVAELLTAARADLTFPNTAGDDADVCLAYSPERVLPGKVLIELVRNDRVIGGLSPRSAQRAKVLYSRFVEGECHLTDSRTAELVKLTENAYRDVNIAFANELSLVSEYLGVDVWDVVQNANRHPRVNILNPGPGVGGHCIAVDPWFIVDAAPALTPLIQAARNVNDGKPVAIVNKVLAAADRFKQPKIACLGLSYKADIDDLRESPAVEIVNRLAEADSAKLLVVEPHVKELPKKLADKPGVAHIDLDQALAEADIVVLLVDHMAFRNLDRSRLDGKVVFDTRGIWR